jgi:NAD(P)-dependent dehydrogenase (short-subunit alcohol dehydrogenase family)
MSIINLPGVALVTGASTSTQTLHICSDDSNVDKGQGIGRAAALSFAAAGVRGLVLSARNTAKLEEAAAEARKSATNPNFETLVVVCDIAVEADIVNLMAQTVEKFGAIDCAVNNAGVGVINNTNMTKTD